MFVVYRQNVHEHPAIFSRYVFKRVSIFSNGVHTHCVPTKTIKEMRSPLDF